MSYVVGMIRNSSFLFFDSHKKISQVQVFSFLLSRNTARIGLKVKVKVKVVHVAALWPKLLSRASLSVAQNWHSKRTESSTGPTKYVFSW
jgi:hypothetical protein